jgi:hypothetical protein
MVWEPRRVAPGGAEVASLLPSGPSKAILRRGSMTRKFVRILLATIAGVALGGITACDQPGPTEQLETEMEEAAEMAAPPNEMAAPPVEIVEPEEDDTE